MLHNKKSQSGFTLVEMMITIGILAILAAIAYPSYMNYIQRARMESARGEMAENIRLMEHHYAKNRTMCQTETNGKCTAMPTAVSNPAANFYDTAIIPDPMSKDSSSYIITSSPNREANYSTNTVQNKQLHMLYYSNGSGFVKCTQSGFNTVIAQTDATGESTGCSVM